jgi:hypothetical protein
MIVICGIYESGWKLGKITSPLRAELRLAALLPQRAVRELMLLS